MYCKCPAGKSITSIPVTVCPESFGQIQKLAFQRLTNDTGERNVFTKEKADITKLLSWSPLLVAMDSTKVVVSPYIEAPEGTAGEARTFGGGNETLGGITEIIGREPTTFTAQMRRQPQSTIAIMKELQCEAAAGNLGVYLIDMNGTIGALKVGSADESYGAIPIRSLFVGDKTLGGLEAPDSNAISFQFMPNWSDNVVLLKPEFNPLTDLVEK